MVAQMAAEYLQADILKTKIADKSAVIIDVVVHESVDSTNNWSLQQCKSGKTLPFACFAEEQSAGRGRRGKPWLMSAHSNIAMSVAWPFVLSDQLLHLLPLSVALSIVEILESLNIKGVQIKWPNDVYVQGKKIAGVLIETQAVKNMPVYKKMTEGKCVAAVIGIGLNYDMSTHEKTMLKDLLVLTDICEEIESQKIEVKPERNLVASILLQSVVAMCQNFKQISKQNLEKFRTQYDFCKEKNVEVILDNNEVLAGIAQGVNDNAELLVLIDGEQRVFNSADVSVKADSNI